MKNRNLLTNIFSIVIIVSLIAFILATFGILPGTADEPGTLSYYVSKVCLPLALVAVACMDIVLPILDNRRKLQEKSYLVKVIVKGVLFLAAVMVLLLRTVLHIESQVLALVLFIVFYLAQFFINLDSKRLASAQASDGRRYQVTAEEEEDLYSYEDDDDVELTRFSFSDETVSDKRFFEYEDDER